MKKVLYILRIVLFVLIIIYAGLYLIARPVPDHPFFAHFTHYPLVIGHADDSGDALWPGNTMVFLEGSAELGVDVLEMDVNMTRDGQIVLMHDQKVDRTTNGTGRVSDFSLAEIQALEVADNWTQDGTTFPYKGKGMQVPTLAAVFEAFPEYPMNIEIKQAEPSMAVELCDLIRGYGREEWVLVASFHDAAMAEFRQACPMVATAPARSEVTRFVLMGFALAPDPLPMAYEAFQVPVKSGDILVVRPGFVWAAHRRNVQIHVWTINDPVEMQRLIDMGVDGIMTDRPDVLKTLLGR